MNRIPGTPDFARRGGLPNLAELDRIAGVVDQLAHTDTDGFMEWEQGIGGGLRSTDKPPTVLARITAAASSPSHLYSWVEVTRDGSGAFVARTGGLSGTHDNSLGLPADEVNDNEAVPAHPTLGAIVWVELAPDGESWLFSWPGAGNVGVAVIADAVTTDQDDYSIPLAPSGATPSIVYLPVNADLDMTGIEVTLANQSVTLVNVGTGTLTVRPQHTDSTAINRIITSTGGDLAVRPGMSVTYTHESDDEERWYVTGGTATSYDETVASQTISASANDLAITNPTPNQRWDVTADYTVTGIVPPAGLTSITITNIGTGLLTLPHQSSSSTAANRIITPHGASLVVPPGGSARLVRDPTSDRWRVPEGSAVNYPAAVYLPEVSAPSTPPSGTVAVYAKSDGLAYSKDDTGTETALGGGSARTEGTLAADGNSQGDAAPLVDDSTEVSGADGTKGVIIPASAAGASWTVYNPSSGGANLKVYPPSGAKIGPNATNAAFTQTAGETRVYYRVTSTYWASVALDYDFV